LDSKELIIYSEDYYSQLCTKTTNENHQHEMALH